MSRDFLFSKKNQMEQRVNVGRDNSYQIWKLTLSEKVVFWYQWSDYDNWGTDKMEFIKGDSYDCVDMGKNLSSVEAKRVALDY